MIEAPTHISCIFRVVGAIVLAAALAGCAVGPNFHPVAAPEVSNYTPEPLPAHTASAGVIGGASQTLQPGADVPGQWWSLFHSAQLDQLIDEALKANPNLAAAQAALREARENVVAQQGYLYPSISGGVTGLRERRLAYKKGVPDLISSPFNLLNTGVNVSYTLDVFGGTRRQVEAYKAQAEYQQFELEAAYLTLTADVVTSRDPGSFATRPDRGDTQADQRRARPARDSAKRIRTRWRFGSRCDGAADNPGANRGDAAAVEQAVGNRAGSAQASHRPLSQRGYRQEFRPLGTSIAARLATESARRNSSSSGPMFASTRRSCMRRARRSALPPQICCRSSRLAAGWEIMRRRELIPRILVWSVAAGIAQPIFEGGTLLHRRRAAIEAYNLALAEYRYTVLIAFQNVADALHALEMMPTH